MNILAAIAFFLIGGLAGGVTAFCWIMAYSGKVIGAVLDKLNIKEH